MTLCKWYSQIELFHLFSEFIALLHCSYFLLLLLLKGGSRTLNQIK
jgi:hypothetical protein